MSNAIKILEKIKRLDILYDIEMTESGEEYMKENDIDLNIIEKELKALEIIRNKEVNVAWFTYVDNLEDYNKGKFIGSYLTQEEYGLLKEVLL